jgi:predicted Zn-dependent protease
MMRLCSAGLSALALLSFACLGSRPVSGQPLTAAPTAAPFLHWPQFPIHVYVPAKNAEQAQKAMIVLAGLDEWVDATHEKVCYIRTTDPSKADITVQFEPGKFLPNETQAIGETQIIGETEVLWSGTTLKKASIRLAEDAGTLEDLQATAAHEFGHALGIQRHSDEWGDLMYPSETLHVPAIDDSLPEETSYVTKHDLRLLAACYPQLLSPHQSPATGAKP